MENDSNQFSNYSDDPEQISEYLIERYGSRDNAIAVAVDSGLEVAAMPFIARTVERPGWSSKRINRIPKEQTVIL